MFFLILNLPNTDLDQTPIKSTDTLEGDQTGTININTLLELPLTVKLTRSLLKASLPYSKLPMRNSTQKWYQPSVTTLLILWRRNSMMLNNNLKDWSKLRQPNHKSQNGQLGNHQRLIKRCFATIKRLTTQTESKISKSKWKSIRAFSIKNKGKRNMHSLLNNNNGKKLRSQDKPKKIWPEVN